MYLPARLPHSVSSTVYPRRRPELSLQSPLGAYQGPLERSYPSPPMSDSPNSPQKPSYPDASSSTAYPSSYLPAPAWQPVQSTMGAMEGSMLSAGPPQPPSIYGYDPRGYGYPGQRPDLQPRPMTTHLGYPQAQYEAFIQPPPMPLAPSTRIAMPGATTYQGPTLAVPGGGPRLQRGSRRTKAHVAKACQNCKKAHLSCDEARPCARCVTSGKQATCIDVEHKKRGRPRLRDDRSSQATSASNQAKSSGLSQAHKRSDSLRVLRSQNYGSGSEDSRPTTAQSGQPLQTYSAPTSSFGPASSGSRPAHAPLSAFLNIELQILKASDELRSLLSVGGIDITGRPLVEFVTAQHDSALQRLQTDLRNERANREPQYLPSIYPDEQARAAVRDLNPEESESFSREYHDRAEVFTFRTSRGQPEQYQVRIRLARTTTFFATMILQRIQPAQPAIAPSPYTRGGAFGLDPSPPVHSPYASHPGSPFSTMPTALIGTLPPPPSSAFTYTMPLSQTQSEQGYFPRQSMQLGHGMFPPPPPPTAPADSRRQSSVGQRQLPPITHSAPTTPSGGQAPLFDAESQLSAGSRRRSPDQSGLSDDEEESRKRRRLNIHDIVDQ